MKTVRPVTALARTLGRLMGSEEMDWPKAADLFAMMEAMSRLKLFEEAAEYGCASSVDGTSVSVAAGVSVERRGGGGGASRLGDDAFACFGGRDTLKGSGVPVAAGFTGSSTRRCERRMFPTRGLDRIGRAGPSPDFGFESSARRAIDVENARGEAIRSHVDGVAILDSTKPPSLVERTLEKSQCIL